MYCTFCGKQIADDAAFCQHCGKPTVQGGDGLAELVAAARTGSQDAVSALYEKTYSKVYYTVKSMIKDEDAVFDIVQDTYIKAFVHLDSFQGDTKFLPWVRQIGANTARDWLKKKRPMLFTELNAGDEQDTPVEELFPDERGENLPEQVIEQEETKRLIREIIEELPEDQRAAIGMFYYEEMSVKEIASAMEVSESAVKSRLMYGRNKIEKKVLELEKKGTKLYGLSPIPFLLLLFRNQKGYAVKTPDARILQTILASQPTGAATAAANTGTAGVRTAGASAGTGTAGSGTASAAAGSLGTLKMGLIALAAVTVVGLGIFGATRMADRSDEPQKTPAMEDVTGMEGDEVSEETETLEELEAQEEPDPVDEALEQYRIIIGQADSYEFETSISDLELVGYRYALVQMRSDDPVPTLLLDKEMGGWVFESVIRVFQYDLDTRTVHQPTETIEIGLRNSISMAGDGDGIFAAGWGGATDQGSVSRTTLDGDTLNTETYWSGQMSAMPDTITFVEIEWHDIGDLSPLDGWTEPETEGAEESGQPDGDTLPTDGDRIVLTGTVGTYDYDGIVALQEQLLGLPDLNGNDPNTVKIARTLTYRVIVLDTPQTLHIRSGGGDGGFSSDEASMIIISADDDSMDPYEGQHITFSIDPAYSWWPSGVELPFGQPSTGDIHVLD